MMIAGEQAGGRGPNAALYAAVPSSAYVAGLYVEADQVSAAVADVTGQPPGRHQRGPQRRRRPGGHGPGRHRPGLRAGRDRLLRAVGRRHRQPRRPRPGDRRAPAGGEPAHLARGRARRAARGAAHPGGHRERREPGRDGRAGRRGRGRAGRLRLHLARHRPRPRRGHQRPGPPGRRRRRGRDRLDAGARRPAPGRERAPEQGGPAGRWPAASRCRPWPPSTASAAPRRPTRSPPRSGRAWPGDPGAGRARRSWTSSRTGSPSASPRSASSSTPAWSCWAARSARRAARELAARVEAEVPRLCLARPDGAAHRRAGRDGAARRHAGGPGAGPGRRCSAPSARFPSEPASRGRYRRRRPPGHPRRRAQPRLAQGRRRPDRGDRGGRPPAPPAYRGRWALPGFIDMHVHGGGGASFTEGGADEARRAAAFHRAHGTTRIVASLVTAPGAELKAPAGACWPAWPTRASSPASTWRARSCPPPAAAPRTPAT